MRLNTLLTLSLLSLAASAAAQVPDDDWVLEESYGDQMLYLHALVNYSFDPQWYNEWERRQFAGNALRVNTGSVTSTQLLTEVDVNVNEPLNDEWRFQGSFRRSGLRQRPLRGDRLLLGFERSIFESSALYVTVDPEFDKEFMAIETGYAFYRDDRQQYVRAGILLEDINYDSKNDRGGTSDREPVSLTWAVRLGLVDDWILYSEGRVGSGFERRFPDATQSPDVSRLDRRSNRGRLRVSRPGDGRDGWSVWLDWFDFRETRAFRQPGFDYDYRNTQLGLAVEHTRLLRDRHRLRLLLNYIDQEAESRGFRQHDYERTELTGGAFYEYLWPRSRATFGYAAGRPDIAYLAQNPADSYSLGEYRDKLIAGWQYDFSENARIHLSLSHEVSVQGFGGGALRFQMFF